VPDKIGWKHTLASDTRGFTAALRRPYNQPRLQGDERSHSLIGPKDLADTWLRSERIGVKKKNPPILAR
jgi:hypothetical protein